MTQFAKALNDNKITPNKNGKALLTETGDTTTTVGDFQIATEPRAIAPHKVGDTVLVCANHNGNQVAASFKNGQWS